MPLPRFNLMSAFDRSTNGAALSATAWGQYLEVENYGNLAVLTDMLARIHAFHALIVMQRVSAWWFWGLPFSKDLGILRFQGASLGRITFWYDTTLRTKGRVLVSIERREGAGSALCRTRACLSPSQHLETSPRYRLTFEGHFSGEESLLFWWCIVDAGYWRLSFNYIKVFDIHQTAACPFDVWWLSCLTLLCQVSLLYFIILSFLGSSGGWKPSVGAFTLTLYFATFPSWDSLTE